MNAIEVKGLTKCFGDSVAVDGISFSVAEGELFALLGVNGAGKTTTIRMLTTLIPPSAGSATVCGYDLMTGTADVRAISGISPQETAIAPLLTVRENLEFMAGVFGCDRREAEQRAEDLIAEYSLGEVASRRAKVLSGGWQRRLSIAMAMVGGPKVLYLDEPTLGLDILARRELWKTVSGLKGKTTVILTTHYLEEAEALSDRIGIMAHGKLLAVGTAAEIKEKTGKATIEDAFVAIAEGEVSL